LFNSLSSARFEGGRQREQLLKAGRLHPFQCFVIALLPERWPVTGNVSAKSAPEVASSHPLAGLSDK
jgi:hypothetical protein